jgi:hypothetical protein
LTQLQKLKTNPTKEELRIYLREEAKKSLYVFGKGVLGMTKMNERLHLPVCNYIQMFPWTGGLPESRRKMLWMPREHFKSTIISIALPLWLLIHDRNKTIAIISAAEKNPKKWLRQIRHILKLNSFFRWLYPEIRPGEKWDQEEIEVTRDISFSGEAQASITAASILSGQASQHYDHVIFDDPVNEKIAISESLMEEVRNRYDHVESLLKGWEGSTFTLVGTPWGRGDVLEHAMETDVKAGHRLYWGIGALGEFKISPQLAGQKQFEPIYEEGEPIFEEECPREKLELLKLKNPEQYYLQYLCKPYDAGRNGFDLNLIRDFIVRADGRLVCDCHPKHVHDIGSASVILTCDPASSEDKRACRSAIVVMAQFPCGCRFLLDEWADRVDPGITVDKIVELTKKWQPHLKHVGVEAIGLQKTINAWLISLKEQKEFPGTVAIHELKPENRQKDARIGSQIMPVRNGLWHKRPFNYKSDQKQNLMWELEKWPYGKSRDIIDAGFGYCEDIWSKPEAHRVMDNDGVNWNHVRERLDLQLMGREV